MKLLLWQRVLGWWILVQGTLQAAELEVFGIPDHFQREGEASTAGAMQLKVLHCRNNLPCCASPACCLQSRNCPTVSRRDAGSSLELWGGNGGKKPNKINSAAQCWAQALLSASQAAAKAGDKPKTQMGTAQATPCWCLLNNSSIIMEFLGWKSPLKALKSTLNSLNHCVTPTLSLNTSRDEKCS